MQGKLFEIPPIRIKRPTIDTIDFYETYNDMADEILEWLNEGDTTVEEIALDLKKTLSPMDIYRGDGYELAKKLESEWGISPNTELVEILNSLDTHIRRACREAEKKWVKDCWITPKYSIGDKVHVSRKNKIYEGEIVEIRSDLAEYVIFVEELGHVREGESGTLGAIEHFEDIEEDFFENKHK